MESNLSIDFDGEFLTSQVLRFSKKMLRGSFTLTIVILVAALSGGHSRDSEPQSPALIESAAAVVRQLAAEDFCAAQKDFDSNLKRTFTTEKLQQWWATIIRQAGAFKQQLHATQQKTPEGYDAVLVTCELEKSRIVIRVVFDVTQKIVGLWAMPDADGSASTPTSPYTDLPQANSAEDTKAAANRVIDLLVAQKFSEVWTMFNSRMKSGLPEQRLRDGWTSLIVNVGSFKRVVESNYMRMDGIDTLLTRCEFEKGYAQIRLAFDADKKIAGLYLLPSQ